MSPVFELMFLSEFPADMDAGEIGKIVRVSRINNANDGLTGVMMFDGVLFCAYLEGPEAAVRRTVSKVAVDARNQCFRLLHQGLFDGARRFEGWHTGIVAPVGASPLLDFKSIIGTAAVDHLLMLYRESRKFGINVV